LYRYDAGRAMRLIIELNLMVKLYESVESSLPLA
jgi:hypothetical protein